MRQIRNVAAGLAALAALASCSEDPPAEAEASPADLEATTSPAPEPDFTLIDEVHRWGPGRWALRAEGDPEAPLAVIDVRAGFQGREDFVWTHDERDLDKNPGQILYQAPTRVPADPCDVDRPSPRLGPTVDDLAAALVAQKRTTTTRPVPTTLDDYRGLYLELSTPEGHDFASCPGDGLVIFESGPQSARPLEFPSTERFWILDIEGRRVVVSAMTPAGAGPKSVQRVTDVVEGVTFVEMFS